MTLLPVHILAGLLALISGAVALYALKGAKLHRKSGIIFVCTMLFMSFSGAVMAALKPERISVVTGALTFYLVTTALLTVRHPVKKLPWIDVGAMLFAVTIGFVSIYLSIGGMNSADGKVDGLPYAHVFFGWCASGSWNATTGHDSCRYIQPTSQKVGCIRRSGSVWFTEMRMGTGRKRSIVSKKEEYS
ncbi:MAG: hypothetical protein ACI9H8_001294 [Lysobacterales bacterium]|jgi:hypothetical protein